MRFALMTEPQQGLSYDELLAVARTAEDAGFEAFFRSDHYTSFPGAAACPDDGRWTTLAGLARETSRINLGVLVSPVTFRIPGAFAKVVMTVDEMSGGRVEVGVGAGWNDLEHAEHGIPYPDTVERVDMLEEELRILTGFWDEPDGWSFEGEHYQVREAYLRPRDRSAYAPGASRRAPEPHRGRLGQAAQRPPRGAVRRRVQHQPVPPDTCRRGVLPSSTTRAEGRPRPERHRPQRHDGHARRPEQAELRDRLADADVRRSGAGPDDAEAWVEERRDRYIIGTPDQVAAARPRVRGGRRAAGDAPGLHPARPRARQGDGRDFFG